MGSTGFVQRFLKPCTVATFIAVLGACGGGAGGGDVKPVTAQWTRRLTPVDVVGLSGGVAAISGGYGHRCALSGGGAVKC